MDEILELESLNLAGTDLGGFFPTLKPWKWGADTEQGT